VMIVIAVLVILLVIGGLVYHFAANGVLSSAAAPTPTVLPGENLFYITTSPSWGTVSVDGHSINSLPHLGGTPLALSSGEHTIKWNASPFSPQVCLVYVPPQQTTSGSCSTNNVQGVQSGKDAGLQATVISFTATSSMLPSTQHTALNDAIQAFLHSLQSSDTVQPGEQFFDLNAPHSITTAIQPLKATLRFHLDTNLHSSIPCVSTFGPGQSCEAQGSGCYTLCDMQALDQSLNPTGGIWALYGIIQMSWDYTTLSGQAVATNQPYTQDSANPEYLMPFFVTWNGSKWLVTDQLAHTGPSTSLNIPPSCLPLEAALTLGNEAQPDDLGITRNTLTAVNIGNQLQSLYWQYYASGPTMASGCLVGTSQNPSNPQTPITNSTSSVYCLYRFGVLLAVNAQARRYWPNLPTVDAYEQHIVQQITSSP
jgi:hypothetical protein